jgi:hypothetical protein
MSSTSTASTLPDYESLAGTWESPELEPLPGPDGSHSFLTRAFDFDSDAWRVRFSVWADPQRKHRLFDGVAEGQFELQNAWPAVWGARAAVFRFTRRLLTVHNRALAHLLTQARAGTKRGAPGIQQDISHTGALDNHILKLRKELEPEPADPKHFHTVHCAGYRFLP